MPCLGMESHGCALLFLLLSICTPAFAALVFTSDCNAVVGDVNLFYTPMASVLSGTTEVELDDTAVRGTGSFPSDDVSNLYLFLQVQDGEFDLSNSAAYGEQSCVGSGWTSVGNAGVYEFVVASASTSGGVRTLTLETALRNAYYLSAKSDTKGQARYQVIRVLACEDIALDGDVQGTRWNGLNGGVTAIVANNELNFNGHDILAPPGFRGGGLVSNPTGFSTTVPSQFALTIYGADEKWDGVKGEGICGATVIQRDATDPAEGKQGYPGGDFGKGAPCNAGGGGASTNAGGGGGGNGGRGGQGGYGWNSGGDICRRGRWGADLPPSPDRLFFGGGGGAGQRNNQFGCLGGPGGGAVIIFAGAVSCGGDGTCSVSADAISAGSPAGAACGNDGGGGGGAGGTIIAMAPVDGAWSSISFSAVGGIGQAAMANHGSGGSGGGGVVFYSTTDAANVNVDGGPRAVNYNDPEAGYDGVSSSCSYIGFLMVPECASLLPYTKQDFCSTSFSQIGCGGTSCVCDPASPTCSTSTCDLDSAECVIIYPDNDGDGYDCTIDCNDADPTSPNGVCETGECTTCPDDCGVCNCDGSCDVGETCDSCIDCRDCDCNGICSTDECGAGTCTASDNCASTCCGNGVCDTVEGETCSSCSEDCGTADSTCDPGECTTCPDDCGVCNCDGSCDVGETCDSCIDCGDCDCNSICSTDECGAGTCTGSDNCASTCCGNGVCDTDEGETCSSCSEDCGTADSTCDAGECATCPVDCGDCDCNGICSIDECNAGTCAGSDSCTSTCCGNGVCDTTEGETCSNCSHDCGEADGRCDAGECTTCPEDCSGRIEWLSPECFMYLWCSFYVQGFCGENEIMCETWDGSGNSISFLVDNIDPSSGATTVKFRPHQQVPSVLGFGLTCASGSESFTSQPGRLAVRPS